LTWVFLRRLIKTKEKKQDNYLYIFILIAVIISGFLLKISLPLVGPVLNKIIPDKVQKKNQQDSSSPSQQPQLHQFR